MTRNTLRNFRAEDFEEAVEKKDEAQRRNRRAARRAKRHTAPEPAAEPEVEEPVAESEETEETSNDDEAVPEGTAKEILAWVGDDELRAQRALDVEVEHEQPRTTLIDDLEKVKNRADDDA